MQINYLILYYLQIVLIIPILLRIFFGDLTNYDFHPGLILHGIILIIMSIDFIHRGFNRKLVKNKILFMIFGFSFVLLCNIIVVEIFQLSSFSFSASFRYIFKTYLFLFLSNFILININFFKNNLNKILITNIAFFLFNVLVGNIFSLGFYSYSSISNSYYGFLSGNDTSIFSFISFGYFLYKLGNKNNLHRKYMFLGLGLSLYVMYLIGTKAIIVSGLITVCYLFNNNKIQSKLPLIILTLVIIIFFSRNVAIQERIFGNYLGQIAQTQIDVSNFPQYMEMLNYIAPGRIFLGYELINTMLNGSVINLFFGYGISGIYSVFGRPPMAEVFSLIGFFGLFGFMFFYLPQLKTLIDIIKKRRFSMVSVMYLSVFLYGTLGGFLYGVTHTVAIFSIFFAFAISSCYSKEYA
jgi:hypothetical protein